MFLSLRISLTLLMSFFCVLFVAPTNATEGVNFKDCGSALSSISEISVSNCGKEPCTFNRGTTVNVSITFVPTVEISKTEMHVWGLISGFPVKFNIPNSDGCKKSGLTCPLKPHVSATYKIQLYIKTIYPRIALVSKWKMVDQDRSPSSVFCFEIPVRLM